jgi:hypothetical protein
MSLRGCARVLFGEGPEFAAYPLPDCVVFGGGLEFRLPPSRLVLFEFHLVARLFFTRGVPVRRGDAK